MEEKRSFKVWFDEVFWYHYKWPFLLAVFFIAVVIFIAVESAGEPEYDMTVVFIQEGYIAASTLDEFAESFAGIVGDINGDGKANVLVLSIDMSDEEGAEYNQQRALLYFMEEEYVLYILDEYYSALYSSLGYFDTMDAYGIEADETFNTRVLVSEADLFEKRFGSTPFYACINDWTTWNKGKPENTDAAVSLIKALLVL